MGTYVLEKSSGGQYHWNLRADNHENILKSEQYKTKGAAFGGISSCKENSGNAAMFDRKTSTDGKSYFNLKAKNQEIIGTSETYNSTAAMENGIQSVMKNGPTSNVDDRTGE